MKSGPQTGVVGAWLALIAFTVWQALVGVDHRLFEPSLWLGGVVLGVAFIKIGVIGWWFMELRTAPLALKLIFGAWVIVVGTTLIVLEQVA